MLSIHHWYTWTAGRRWHIDCFRCNTCGVVLDADTNLLLLGDGSLVCNDCTYNCSVCQSKIEDLAILTGDQVYCADCFKCRNCKKKIENLKYARTSQGIFCMHCHEALMRRRRRKRREKDTIMLLDERERNTFFWWKFPTFLFDAFTRDQGVFLCGCDAIYSERVQRCRSLDIICYRTRPDTSRMELKS